jgi:hypothetical protein
MRNMRNIFALFCLIFLFATVQVAVASEYSDKEKHEVSVDESQETQANFDEKFVLPDIDLSNGYYKTNETPFYMNVGNAHTQAKGYKGSPCWFYSWSLRRLGKA